MSYSYTCNQVSVASINIGHRWDIHPFLPVNSPNLQTKESIQAIGLLHPPLVLQHKDSSFEAITGSRSLYFYFEGEHTPQSIFCRILTPETPERVILRYVYEEYSATKDLTPIELAHFYRLCEARLEDKEQNDLLKALLLDESPRARRRILELLKLSDEAQLAMMHGQLPENMARELLKLSTDDRSSIFKLFRQLNAGGGKQKRLTTLLRDLAGRQGKKIAEIIAQSEVQDILLHTEMNLPQKTHSLLQLLQQLHSPSLHQAEQQFRTWQSQFALPKYCSIEHSQAFEKDEVTLRVTFNGKDHFAACWEKLHKLLEDA